MKRLCASKDLPDFLRGALKGAHRLVHALVQHMHVGKQHLWDTVSATKNESQSRLHKTEELVTPLASWTLHTFNDFVLADIKRRAFPSASGDTVVPAPVKEAEDDEFDNNAGAYLREHLEPFGYERARGGRNVVAPGVKEYLMSRMMPCRHIDGNGKLLKEEGDTRAAKPWTWRHTMRLDGTEHIDNYWTPPGSRYVLRSWVEIQNYFNEVDGAE